MEKTISITLGGTIFNIEEDAYNELDKYLESIREYYESSESEEILADIELSIAEKFSSKINNKKKVITKKDVETIVKVMGRAEDFEDENKESEKNKDSEEDGGETKKLYRDSDDVIIAGVCSGVSAYFGIDAVFVRIIFVLLAFMQGIGIILYIILWIVMPEAKTASQKLEMRGKPVNLKKLEETVKEKSNQIRSGLKKNSKKGLMKIIYFPFEVLKNVFNFIRRVLRVLWPVLGFVAGLSIILVAIFLILSLTFLVTALIFHIDSPYIVSDIPLQELARHTSFYVALISGFLTLFVPFIFILLLGLTWLRRKNAFRFIFSSIMIVVWMMSVVIFGVSSLDLIPFARERIEEQRQINTISKEYSFDDIDSLRIGANGKATVRKGDEFKLSINGEETVLDNLNFEVKEGELQIYQKNKREGICFLCFDKEINLDITMPELKSFIAFQDLDVELDDFKQADMRVNAGESSFVQVKTSTGTLESYISGINGKVEIIGSPKKLNVVLEGFGKLEGKDLNTEEIVINQNILSRVNLSGTSNKLIAEVNNRSKLHANGLLVKDLGVKTTDSGLAEVYAQDKIQAIAQDDSNISYKGEPREVDIKTSGNGKVVRINDYDLKD